MEHITSLRQHTKSIKKLCVKPERTVMLHLLLHFFFFLLSFVVVPLALTNIILLIYNSTARGLILLTSCSIQWKFSRWSPTKYKSNKKTHTHTHFGTIKIDLIPLCRPKIQRTKAAIKYVQIQTQRIYERKRK